MHLLLRSIIHTKLKLLEAYTKSVRPTYVLEQHFGIPHEGEHVSALTPANLPHTYGNPILLFNSMYSTFRIWRQRC